MCLNVNMRAQPEHKEAAALTNLVFPFHGKFHHQLLGVGANEDEWRSRLLADLGTLKRERGNNEMCSVSAHGERGGSERLLVPGN